MSPVIPLKVKKRRDPDLPTGPVVLTPTEFATLVELWNTKDGVYSAAGTSKRRFTLGLQKYGYAMRDEKDSKIWHITQDGIDRLLAPMRLVF